MNNINNILNKENFTNVIYYTEFTDGRKYIGQTKAGFLKRHKDHLKATKPTHYDQVLKKHMDEAIIYPIAYGVEDIEGIDTQDLLNGLEVAEIMLRETFNNVDKKHGLNHTTGGYSFKISQELKNKLSKAQKEKYNNLSDEEKEKMRKRNSENAKGNKNALGYKHTEEAKQKMSDANKGKTVSKETKQKIKKYWESEEGQIQKEKLSNERKKFNIENILDCIEKYMTTKEFSKKFNTHSNTINTELRRHGFPSYSSLRNEVISEDLINSRLTINEFATKYNIKENEIKKALTQTGKKYLIKML